MREILINLPNELVEYLDSNPYISDRSEFISMREILINLPNELVEYLDSNPYISDRSEFIAMLIKRWQKEVEKSKREIEQAENDPHVLKDFCQ